MKQQVFVVHGGEAFDTYEKYLTYLESYEIDFDVPKTMGWKDNLAEDLGEDYEVIRPSMPSPKNAKYFEWKMWFEKYIPHLRDGVIFVGHSLGGIFLAKYLSEHHLPRDIRATILVAAPYDDSDRSYGYSLADFAVPPTMEKCTAQGGELYLIHSSDDPVVPYADLGKYTQALPFATPIVFDDRGHFNQEQFPEIVELIQNLSDV